jgi:hypothetical protein
MEIQEFKMKFQKGTLLKYFLTSKFNCFLYYGLCWFFKKSIFLNYISGKIQNDTQLKYFLTPIYCFFHVTVSAGFFKNLIFKNRFATKILEKIKKN